MIFLSICFILSMAANIVLVGALGAVIHERNDARDASDSMATSRNECWQLYQSSRHDNLNLLNRMQHIKDIADGKES